jgi:hypothetical protein
MVELPVWQVKHGAVEVTTMVLLLPWVPLLGVPVTMGWVPVWMPVPWAPVAVPVACLLMTLLVLTAGSFWATPAETPAARARTATEGAVKCILLVGLERKAIGSRSVASCLNE